LAAWSETCGKGSASGCRAIPSVNGRLWDADVVERTDQFARLERVNARDGWKGEAQDFTPWLAGNLDRLGEQLGLALELRETEHGVGRYSLDILADDVTGRLVVIENQLGPSDHDHLGKLLTYCAGTDARVVIWVAAAFTPEHLAAFEWLNRNTSADVGFFAVQVELLRIGDSPLAPHFQPLVRPNEWVKEASPVRQVTEWDWDAYDRDLRVPLQRITIAERIVEGLTAAIDAAQKPWQLKFRKGYAAFQRSGGYNVIVVDVWWNKPVRLAVKLPPSQTPDSLGLSNPFPQLATVWVDYEREWGWTIPSIEAIPDLQVVVQLASQHWGAEPTGVTEGHG
jgi:hypothetical protein